MNDDNVVSEFLVESYENLDQLDQDFVELEQNPSDRDRLSSIFRTIHTIKGTCGFLGFGKLEKVAHVGENLLSRLRDGVLDLTPEITSALLKMVDAVREMLDRIEHTGGEGDTDYSALVSDLTRLQEETKTAEEPEATPTTETSAPATSTEAPTAELRPTEPGPTESTEESPEAPPDATTTSARVMDP